MTNPDRDRISQLATWHTTMREAARRFVRWQIEQGRSLSWMQRSVAHYRGEDAEVLIGGHWHDIDAIIVCRVGDREARGGEGRLSVSDIYAEVMAQHRQAVLL